MAASSGSSHIPPRRILKSPSPLPENSTPFTTELHQIKLDVIANLREIIRAIQNIVDTHLTQIRQVNASTIKDMEQIKRTLRLPKESSKEIGPNPVKMSKMEESRVEAFRFSLNNILDDSSIDSGLKERIKDYMDVEKSMKERLLLRFAEAEQKNEQLEQLSRRYFHQIQDMHQSIKVTHKSALDETGKLVAMMNQLTKTPP